MSQAGIVNLAAGPVPPFVPTSFVTNVNSPSVPIANIENVLGGQISSNNINGIQTDGSSGGNTLTIQLTNRIEGTVTTIDATPTTLTSFALPATGIYSFIIQVLGNRPADGLGVSYFIQGAVRTNGGFATLVGVPTKFINEDIAVCDANLIVSGNNVIVQVIGEAISTISWRALSTYIFVV